MRKFHNNDMLVLNSCVWSENGKDIIKLLNEEEEIYNNTILTMENVASFLGILILKNSKILIFKFFIDGSILFDTQMS